MSRLFRFSSTLKRDPDIEAWMAAHRDELGSIAKYWFDAMRDCGEDVREILYDGHPTACVGDAAFAYVNAFTAHVNVGFFHGAELDDPSQLLEGTGKIMRVKGPKSHLRMKKAKRVKRLFDEKVELHPADRKRISRLIPYGVK